MIILLLICQPDARRAYAGLKLFGGGVDFEVFCPTGRHIAPMGWNQLSQISPQHGFMTRTFLL